MRILILADGESVRPAECESFRDAGWEVDEAGDPARALDLLERSPDWVVAGLAFAGTPVAPILGEIRARRPATRVAVVAASKDPDMVESALRFGPELMIARPVVGPILVEALALATESSRHIPPARSRPG